MKEEKDEAQRLEQQSGMSSETMEQSQDSKGPKSPKPSTSQTDMSSKEALKRKKLEQIEEESKKMQFVSVSYSKFNFNQLLYLAYKNRVLMANFSEEQLNRYEMFRRSAFQKSTVKKVKITILLIWTFFIQ